MNDEEIKKLALANNLTYEDMRKVLIIQTKIVNLMKLKENNKLDDMENIDSYLESLNNDLDELIIKSNNISLSKWYNIKGGIIYE